MTGTECLEGLRQAAASNPQHGAPKGTSVEDMMKDDNEPTGGRGISIVGREGCRLRGMVILGQWRLEVRAFWTNRSQVSPQERQSGGCGVVPSCPSPQVSHA